MSNNGTNLRFDGSIWCNLDIALRNMDQIYRQIVQPLGISVIEVYILRALYERDGQHASELARAVGRAATSFTPNLDKLQSKGLIKRKPDPGDRRAVRIYLTKEAQTCKDEVLENAQRIDENIRNMFSQSDFQAFERVLSGLQTVEPEQV